MLANALTTLAQQAGLEIVERCDLAGRAAKIPMTKTSAT